MCVRFIINLPHEELESVERICFQVEEAQWFYEDFIRPLDPALPSLSLKAFSLRIFQHCPLMSQWSHYHHMTAFSEFLAYKTRVPVRGAILLNQEMDEVVLVKGWKKGANWSFPRGKINKGEGDLDCAIREVYEETGFDVRQAGLIKNDEDVKHIEITMREQHMRLYIFSNVPRGTYFEPRTRKEISKIEWYKLSELPTLKKNKQHDEGLAVANANKFYMVAPFLHPLKKWIAQQKKIAAKTQAGVKSSEGYISMEENGHRIIGTPALRSAPEPAVPSDLPEVTTHDASSHLKQLLNIGGPLPPTGTLQAPASSSVDQSKSNGLLDLLRKGKQEAVPNSQSRELPLPSASHPGAPHVEQPAHLAPNFFPGFPQQQQHLAPSTFMQQTPIHTSQVRQQSFAQPLLDPAQHASVLHPPRVGQQELSGSPASQQNPQIPAPYPQSGVLHSPPFNAMPPKQAAPFQRTGDPQFSQPTQLSQLPSAQVPPASKLPPPKLTSHSLKLLDVFKANTPKGVPSPQAATLIAHEQGQPQAGKTSLHQDSLLDLFRGARTAPAPQPVELGGRQVPTTSVASKQILQRPSQPAGPNLLREEASHAPTGPSQRPSVGKPQLETRPNSSSKRDVNGFNRRESPSRRPEAQPQQLFSPITILPRPQSAKREGFASTPALQATQASSHNHTHQPAATEPVKPFQPQILRRSEKSDYDKMLMAAPKIENNIRKPSLPGLHTNSSELAPHTNFDRRPSQTAAQKEALLSLFGQPAVSPGTSSHVQLDTRAANQHAPTLSGLVSPLSSFQLHSSGEGTSSEGEMASNRVTSPTNKEFLLGYLQGVAQGHK